MLPYIPYGKQDIQQEDIDAVINVLKSDWITQGPTISRFEQTVAEYCGAKYAVAVSNATAALHISCLAAGLGSEDILWTSPITFVASANCGRYCGAQVDFIDIDPATYNLSIAALAEKLAIAEKANKPPKVVVPVHLAGQSCEMAAIAELAERYKFTILEDASHAIGACYNGKKVGNCEFSDMAVFSFHPVKIVTTGEGGMILTNRKDIYDKLIRLRTHGITRDKSVMQGESHGPWYYQQLELGYNYRITDIQAALGVSQMQRLDAFIARRRRLAAQYNHLLKELPLTLPAQHPDTNSSWHLYIIRVDEAASGKSHREVFEALRAASIGVNLHYIPVHTQPYYQQLGFQMGDYPQAESYYQEAISIPLFYGLTDADQQRIAETLKTILSGAKIDSTK